MSVPTAILNYAITTGQQVITLVNESYRALNDAIAGREVTSEEIADLVKHIVSNGAAIQTIE